MNSYLLKTGIIDSLRSRGALFANGMIVAMLSMLVLAISGGKRGIADRMRDEILRSPTATEHRIYPGGPSTVLSSGSIPLMRRQLPGNPVIIPMLSKVVSFSTPRGKVVDAITCECTAEGDPFLQFHGVSVKDLKFSDVILSDSLAAQLGIALETGSDSNVGGSETGVEIKTTRLDRGGAVSASANVRVRGVIRNPNPVAWLSQAFLEALNDFAAGKSVAELGWIGRSERPDAVYSSMLSFVRMPYDEKDLRRLHLRGLHAELISPESTKAHWRTLCGVLSEHPLSVYQLTARGHVLRISANDVERMTSVDDVCLQWSPPESCRINNATCEVVPLIQPHRWLKTFIDPLMGGILESASDQLFTLRLLEEFAGTPSLTGTEGHADFGLGSTIKVSLETFRRQSPQSWKDQLRPFVEQLLTRANQIPGVQLNENVWIRKLSAVLREEPAETTPPGRLIPLCYASPELMALVEGVERGALEFDELTNDFVASRSEYLYSSARVYAASLDDVPVLDDTLQKQGFLTTSSRTRIEEMRGHIGSLDRLVIFLLIVIGSLGVCTMLAVFGDVTHRKRSTIGILRVMGATSAEVFFFLAVRSVLVAFAGWLICLPFCFVIELVAPALLHHDCIILWTDQAVALLGAVICCMFGVALPSLHAVSLDPAEVIRRGKTT